MTTNPNATDADLIARFDAYWIDSALNATETLYGHARNAYLAGHHAAATGLGGLERSVVAAAEKWRDAEWGQLVGGAARALRDEIDSMRAARQPAPVDHLQRALTLIDKAQIHSRTDSDQEQYLDDARQHIESAIAAREASK